MKTQLLLCITVSLCAVLSNGNAQNTIFGSGAGQSLSSGQQNTFLGYRAGVNNANASANTFIGHNTGASNTSGQFNTFIGVQAGINNTVGSSNFMLGTNAGTSNTTGSANIFIGDNTGGNNNSGGYNLYIGTSAGNGPGVNGDNNVSIGFESGRNNNSGATNTFLGFRADAGGAGLVNATAIGANAIVSASNTIVLGNNANVGIGTSNPGNFRLAVEGVIGAREIQVRVGSWSDFVFQKNYRLRPLSEVESYIQIHKHLPDVPAEATVMTDGVAIGEMSARLLQKVEELTLYVIALEKRAAGQARQLTALKQKINHR